MRWTIWALLIVPITGCYLLFRDTMNRFQSVGPLYWITRDIGSKRDPIVSRAIALQTAPPWKKGKGIQFRAGKYTFQVGLCKARPQVDEALGLLAAMDGRYLDVDPSTIGEEFV